MKADERPLLRVRALTLNFWHKGMARTIVNAVSFCVAAGECVGLVGESGSGKSLVAQAIMGLLPAAFTAHGEVALEGEPLLGKSEKALNALRGKSLAMVFQEPMSALDPLYTIGAQLMAPLRQHTKMGRAQAYAKAVDMLRRTEIADPVRAMRAYPHELSGGQRQRVAIAQAISLSPRLLIADEPTTALDVTVQAQILRLLRRLQQESQEKVDGTHGTPSKGMGIVFISHDLDLVARFCSRVLVMNNGAIVEEGKADAVLENPRHAYTRMLVSARPQGRTKGAPKNAPALVEAKNISVHYRLRAGVFRAGETFRAVDDVCLTIQKGETLGLVGESGSGKSTLGRALLRLVPASGLIRFEDRALAPLSQKAMRPLRKSMQIVFQDPYGALSPRMTVADIITEGLRIHAPLPSAHVYQLRAQEALDEVGLPADFAQRYPHELSGGQRQRVAIARALILAPKFLVLDEPTSALDRSVQSDVLNLLTTLQARHGLTCLFISHDLAVISAMADRVCVMRAGKIIEQGSTAQIFQSPREDYTRALIAAAGLRDFAKRT